MDGELVPVADARVSVFDHGLLYGDGVFEGIRAYAGRIFKLETHLRRLETSARAIRLELPYSRADLADATRRTCAANGIADGYIRLVVTRGDGPLGINPFHCPTPRAFVIAAALELFPAELVESGIRVGFSSYVRSHPQTLSPRIKSLNYLNNVLAKAEAIDQGVHEAIMCNHLGQLAEGSADNLFLVRRRRDGVAEIATPGLSTGPLGGITRGVALDLAEGLGIPTAEAVLTRFDVQTADEVFITGTGAEIVPVIEAGGVRIGDGRPGPVTRRIIDAFRDLVRRDAPED